MLAGEVTYVLRDEAWETALNIYATRTSAAEAWHDKVAEVMEEEEIESFDDFEAYNREDLYFCTPQGRIVEVVEIEVE